MCPTINTVNDNRRKRATPGCIRVLNSAFVKLPRIRIAFSACRYMAAEPSLLGRTVWHSADCDLE